MSHQTLIDSTAFAKATEAMVEWRSKYGTHWSLEPLQVFAETYEKTCQRGISVVDEQAFMKIVASINKDLGDFTRINQYAADRLFDGLNSYLRAPEREAQNAQIGWDYDGMDNGLRPLRHRESTLRLSKSNGEAWMDYSKEVMGFDDGLHRAFDAGWKAALNSIETQKP
jgi:hypothetical protein